MQDRADKIPRKKLQLVGVTSMFIAAKYEEMYAPEIGKMCSPMCRFCYRSHKMIF